MRTKRSGQVYLQHLTVVALVGLGAVGGLSTLGGAFGRSIDKGAESTGARMPVSVAVGSQAGLASTVRGLAETAQKVKEARPLRALRSLDLGLDLGEMGHARRARRIVDDIFDGVKFDVPWDRIHADNVEAIADAAIVRAETRLGEVTSFTGTRNYTNTIVPLSDALEEVGYIDNVLSHLDMVLDSDELSDAYARAATRMSDFRSNVWNRKDLWEAVNQFSEVYKEGDLANERLAHAQSIYSTLKSRQELDPAAVERMTALSSEIQDLSLRFRRNIEAAQRDFGFWVSDESRLLGVPDHVKSNAAAAAAAAGRPGEFKLGYADGSMGAVIAAAHDASLREEVWRALHTMATEGATDNRPLIERLLELRREVATNAGDPSYAEHVTRRRMVGGADAAEKFVADLADRTRPFQTKELDELRAFRKSVDGIDRIEAWDYDYWARNYRRTLFGPLDVTPYLTVDNVLNGAFAVADRLYGIKVEEIDLAKWHPDVRSFRILDEDGHLIGNLQMDLFARRGKRNGAWQSEVILGEGQNASLGLITASVPGPHDGLPAMLTMSDAETVFHEFGHALHMLFSEVEVRSFGGTNVSWDFVELPSQIMENWVWEKEALDMFAHHYATGEKIPDELFAKLVESRRFGAAQMQMRQLANAGVDLALYHHYDPAVHGDAMTYARQIMQGYMPYDLPEDYAYIATLHHIFSGGYSAGYYGYKWAEVLDADAFSRFAKEGIFNRSVGEEFRRGLLSRGGTESAAADLFRKFMGREPDIEALLRRLGLIDEAPDTTPNNVVRFPKRDGTSAGWRHAA